MDPAIVYTIVVLLSAVILHECAHGWVAYRLGDPTAKRLGRLTLNPLRHIDPVGTILVPAVLNFFHLMPLGWAKAVPIDPSYFRNPRRDMMLVAAAGPGINLLIALAASGVLRLEIPPAVSEFCIIAVVINLLLAIFNLTPVPPLDGSRIIMGILPYRWARVYSQLEPFGLVLVIVLLNFGLMRFLEPVVVFLASFLLGRNLVLS